MSQHNRSRYVVSVDPDSLELEVEWTLQGPVVDGELRVEIPTWVPGDYTFFQLARDVFEVFARLRGRRHPSEDAIRVARTGGMLGRTRAAVLELEVIPGDDRDHLDTLVASGRLAELDGKALPDAPTWRVTVETRCDVTVAEPLLPDEVLALFRRLLELGDAPER